MSRQNKESANLKIGQWKLSSLRKGKKRKKIKGNQMEYKRPMGHHQIDQHRHGGDLSRRGIKE